MTPPTPTNEPPALPGDGLREGIIDDLRRRIGDAVVDTHISPNDDLWVRVQTDAWRQTAEALKAAGFTFFSFLSGLDWMPSPYGKGEEDPTAEPQEPDTEIRQGVTGGETRFQVFARLVDLDRHVGVTIKADVPDEPFAVDSWTTVFAGANWHERECHEMFGIGFNGHPDLRNMYLPTDFEGYPLRKDFPLLARMIKPWPGIVDVEPMPAQDERDSRRARRGRAVVTILSDRQQLSYIASQAADARLNVELETEGMTLNIGPQHPATHGTLRIICPPRRRAGRLGRAVGRLHAPRLREAHRGPHVPAGHHAGQPDRLARQLRQRGAVHPRRREADGDRGAAAGPGDPHDPVRAVAHRQRVAVPR